MKTMRLAGIAEADKTMMRRSYKRARSMKHPPRKRSGGKKSHSDRDPDNEVWILVMKNREGHIFSSALDTVNYWKFGATAGPVWNTKRCCVPMPGPSISVTPNFMGR